jgi:hypothetical protein
MKLKTITLLALAAFVVVPMSAKAAQVQTAEFQASISETSTIVAIDAEAKSVTLAGPEGDEFTLTIDPENVYLSNLTLGQEVTTTQAINIVAELRAPLEEELAEPFVMEVDTGSNNNINDPAASLNTKIRMVATITAHDKEAGTATLTGPNGRSMVVNPTDPKVEKHLKVGKTVIIFYTSLRIIKLDPVAAE